MRTFWLLCAALLALSAGATRADQTPQAIPELHLYKTGFAKGENLEFSLSVKDLSRTEILALNKAGVVGEVVIKPPHGRTSIGRVDLQYTGLSQNFRLGYNYIRKETLLPGRYRLQFRIGKQQTAPINVQVAELPVLRKVEASLRLEAGSGFPDNLAATNAILTVRNDTDQTVRFPRPIGMDGLSFSVRAQSGALEGSTFDNASEYRRLPGTLLNAFEFTWDAAEVLPTVTLKPGETFEQKIPLKASRDVYVEALKDHMPLPPGRYAVTLAQTLNVLIGDRHDPLSVFFPVRLPLKVTTEFTSGPAL